MGRAIEAITKTSEDTGKIIKTIDEILLALNAAVEAVGGRRSRRRICRRGRGGPESGHALGGYRKKHKRAHPRQPAGRGTCRSWSSSSDGRKAEEESPAPAK